MSASVAGDALDLEADGGQKRGDAGGLVEADLKESEPVFGQQLWQVAKDFSVTFEPVGAAIQRQRRIMQSHLGLETCDVLGADIGGIGNDEVETSLKRLSPAAA